MSGESAMAEYVDEMKKVAQEVRAEPFTGEQRGDTPACSLLWAAVAQWGKGVVLQPQGCRFDPRSPH